MSQLSHIYLHLPTAGDPDACAALRAALAPTLKAMYARGELRGYQLFLLRDRDAAEDELLHHMFDYAAATHGKFPFVYVALTPPAEAPHALDAMMQGHGFQRFA